MSEFLQQSYSSSSHPRARITLKSYTDGGDDEDDEDGAAAAERVGTARLLKRFRSFIKVRHALQRKLTLAVRLCPSSL